MAILRNLNELSREQLIAQLEAVQAATERKLTLKVTDKGGVSLYGLGRFPVTLYASQWDKLIASINTVQAFINTNRASLTIKA